MNDTPASRPPADEDLLYRPDIRIDGEIGEDLRHQVEKALRDLKSRAASIIVHINTSGGDADAGRGIAAELGLFQQFNATPLYMVGKTRVYSAGVTILAAAPPERRFLTADAMLLVHERRQHKTLDLAGPLQACLQIVREEISTLQADLELERQGFEAFIRGSSIDIETLYRQARGNWYLTATEALGLGLIGGIIGRKRD